MPPEEFEPAIPATERPQTHALDRMATEIGTTGHAYQNSLSLNAGLCFSLSLSTPDSKKVHSWR
jgi:hypothetical protein